MSDQSENLKINPCTADTFVPEMLHPHCEAPERPLGKSKTVVCEFMHLNSPNNMNMRSFVIITLIARALGGTLISPYLTFSPDGVWELSTYQINFETESSVSTDYRINVDFPSGFSLTPSSSYACTAEINFSEPSSYHCEATSSQLVVVGGFTDVTNNFGVSVTLEFQVTNPPSSKTLTIGLSVTDSGGAVIDSELNGSLMRVSATPAQLTAASIAPQSNTIGALSLWEFSFTPTYEIPSGSEVIVTFPYLNRHLYNDPNNVAESNLMHFVQNSSPTCAGVDNMDAGLSCSYVDADLELTATLGFTSSVSAGTAVKFTVSDVKNPISPDAISGFSYSITDGSGGEYENSDGITISVSASDANNLTVRQASPTSVATVGESVKYTIGFSVTNFLYAGCKIKVEVPSEITFTGNLIGDALKLLTDPLTVSLDSSNNIIVTNGVSDFTPITGTFYFSLETLTNPSSTIPTGDFTITTLSPSDHVMDTGTGGSFTATPGAITQYNSQEYISPDNPVVGTVTTYTFEFQNTHAIPSNGFISITYPGEITFAARDANNLCHSVIAGLHTDAKCEVDGLTIKIHDGFPSGLGTSSRIAFEMDEVTNSASTAVSATFQIFTHPAEGFSYIIDQVTSGVTVTATPSPLKAASVSSAVTVTGETTTYTFNIETNTQIGSDGYVIVTFPDEVEISDAANASSDCSKITWPSVVNFTCQATVASGGARGTLRVNGFDSGSFPPGILEFSVGYILNPSSTKPSQSFAIATYDKDGNVIDMTSTDIKITMDTANELVAVVMTPESLVNGELTKYTALIRVKNVTPVNLVVLIEPPSAVVFQPAPTCQGVTAVSTVVCQIVDSTKVQATLTLTSELASSSDLSFSITQAQNPPTTQPTDSFKVYTFTSDNYAIDKKETTITVSTTQAALITGLIISGDTLIGATADYTFVYTPVNTHPANTKISVTIPSVINSDSVTVESSVLTGFTVLKQGIIVTIQDGFSTAISAPDTISFVLKGLVNPVTQATADPWIIQSSTGSYLIDKSDDQVTAFTCSSPCLTCETSPTTCLSCDSAGANPYFYDDTCNPTCKSGEVDLVATAETVCVPCNSPCTECTETADKCTACDAASSNPFLYGDTCNSVCPDGQYGENTSCIDCVNPCKNCESATDCLSCEAKDTAPNLGDNTYLLNKRCLLECDAGYLENSTTFVCDACTNGCADCEGSLSTCTACDSSTRLKEGECVASCPADQKYIDDGASCLPCTSPCETCQTAVTTCLSCVTGGTTYYLYSNSCIETCPVGTIASGSRCYDCVSPCSECSGGTTTCTACENGFLLELTSCVSTCSDGYLSDGINCNACNSSCKTCSGTVNTCASCENGKYLHQGTCIDQCPSDEYIPDPGVCTPCNSPCVTCSGTPDTCKTCAIGQFLYNNTCVTGCPDDVSIESGTDCLSCSSSCKTCSGTVSTCTSCESPQLLQSTQCVDACAGGYIVSSSGEECIQCDPVCFDCETTSTNCISCPTNTYLYNNWCQATCPENYMPSSGECVEIVNAAECSPGCTDVMLANTSCDSECNVDACQNDNGQCNKGPTTCADGQYQVGDECFACVAPCNLCESEATCTSCQADSNGVTMLLYEGSCYSTCPDGSAQTSSLACTTCNVRCSKCVGAVDTCTECKSSYFLYNNQCINSCPVGLTIVGADNASCEDCNSNCATCDTTVSNCLSCADGSFLQGSVCKSSCDSGYTTTSSSAGVCRQCHSDCSECSGEITTCTECAGSKFLYNNQCLDSCPNGTYSAGNICSDCQSSCVTCSGVNNCSACATGFSYFQGLCEENCPAGYEDTAGVCTQIVVVNCADGCTDDLFNNDQCNAACDNEDCAYDNGKCINDGVCNAGDYFDGSACQPCVTPCKTCTSASVCTSCQEGTDSGGNAVALLLYNSGCVYPCPSGTMQSNAACLDCDSNCEECAGAVDTCVSCPASEYLHNGSCTAACPVDTSIKDDTLMICRNCSSDCATCTTTIENCTSCPDGKVLQGSLCQSSCDPGYTTTSTFPNTCKACTGDCVNCVNETGNCTECNSSLLLFEGVCYSTCPERISVQSGNECVACESPCAECANSKTTCTVCENGYYLHIDTCSTTCPQGYEPNLGVCQTYCSEGCTQDLLNNDVCDVACNTDACTQDKGQCPIDTSCPVGQYRDGSDCTDCVYPCNTCASQLYCTACQISNVTGNQLYLYNGNCLDSCSDQTFQNGIICEDCDSDCFNCQTTADNCISCPNGEKLYNNSCLPSCPVGTTIENSGQCYDCDNVCAKCSGTIDTCTECPDGSFLSGTTCLAECPAGSTTTPTSNGACESCSSSCLTCLGSITSCTSCDGKILHENACLDTCPDGYTNTTADPDICTQCSSGCANCQDSITYCTSCPSGQNLTSSNTCQVEALCPDGTTLTDSSNGVCVSCISPCKTCETTQTTCLTCVDGLGLDNGTCQPCTSPCKFCDGGLSVCTACIEGYFLSGAQCNACSADCLTCETNSFTCTACEVGKRLIGSSCFECNGNCATCEDDLTTCTSCPDGQFLISGACQSCNPSCNTCENNPTNCTSCNPGDYLDGAVCNNCDSTCAECVNTATTCTACTTGKTLINGVCGTCDSNCATCVEAFDKCASCADGLDLVNNQCGVCSSDCATCITDFATCQSCEAGKYLQGTTCVGCDSNCATCDGSPTVCTACTAPLLLLSNACVPCDPSCATCGPAIDTCTGCANGLSLIQNQCLQCDSGCSTCTSSVSYCTACLEGWYLSGTSCLSCDASCKTCETNANNCVTCPTGSDLVGNSCEQTCADGKFLDGATCVSCAGDCATCTGLANFCTSCLSSPILYNNQCYSSCPTGTFETGSTCNLCSSSCKECENSASNCISCETGFRLESGNCVQICDDGEYYNGSTCEDCDSDCLTCSSSATNCETCDDPTEVPSDQCRVPCEDGKTRTSSSGDTCVDCDSQCAECSGATSHCTECSNAALKLHNGFCLENCPANSTVQVDTVCVDCSGDCLTCKDSPVTCTSCNNNLLLYTSICVSDCPTDYYANGGTCEECPDLNNCPPANETNTTTPETPEEDDTFDSGPVPFPFTGFVVITAGLVAAAKLAAAGVGFIATSIAVWGFAATCSWVFLGMFIPLSEGDGEGEGARRLFIVSGTDGDLLLSVCVLLICSALGFCIICNVFFGLIYCRKILRRDKTFLYWRKRYSLTHCISLGLALGVCFHCIRLIISNICDKAAFNAQFDDKRKLLKPLLKLGYVSMLCVCVPMIVAQILLLVHYPVSNWMWMFALDSLIVTLLLLLMLIIDTIKTEKELLNLETQKRLGKDFKNMIPPPENSIENLISNFPHLDFRSLVPPTLQWFRRKKEKGLSKSKQPSRSTSPIPETIQIRRKMSFPPAPGAEVELDPDFWRPQIPPKILDEPHGESQLKGDDTFAEDPTLLDPITRGEFEFSTQEFKRSVVRPKVQAYAPLNMDPRTEEFTEVVAFTEEHSESEQEPNFEEIDYSALEQSYDPNLPLGTIEEENEIELERAIPDSQDPEVISVPHKQSGHQVKLRKEFKGARIVDLENKVIESAPPIDSAKYHIPSTVVDDEDVRFATLVAHSGEKVRVKRNFRGARIVDLEKKIKHPNAHLVGQTVQEESDFAFNNAYPDPENPEVVVVTHHPTGEEVKIRKTFHGAQVIDEFGDALPNTPAIDRNDYDIPKTIVDKEDVHVATLKHKVTQKRVRVRRNFRGAKIVDLERKAEGPRRIEKLEPEPLSREDSFQDLPVMKGWVSPKIEDSKMFEPKIEPPKFEVPRKEPKQFDNRSRPPPVPLPKEVDPARERLQNLAHIISNYEGDSERFVDLPYKNPESDDDFESINSGRGREFDHFQPGLMMNDSASSILSGVPKRRRKKPKKAKVEPTGKMRGLEDIYLQRLDAKKKNPKAFPRPDVADFMEPEFEDDDFPAEIVPRNHGTERALHNAGDEIVNGRRGFTGKRDFF